MACPPPSFHPDNNPSRTGEILLSGRIFVHGSHIAPSANEKAAVDISQFVELEFVHVSHCIFLSFCLYSVVFLFSPGACLLPSPLYMQQKRRAAGAG